MAALGERPRRRESDHAGADDGGVDLLPSLRLRLLILPIDRVLVTGANGQLAAFIVQAFADREVMAYHAPVARRDRSGARGCGGRRHCARPHRQLRRVQRCGWRREPGQSRRWRSTRWRCAAWPARPRRPVRRWCTTAPTSSSTARARAPRRRRRPSPPVCMPRRKLLGEWFALEVPRAYVLRVESLFGSPAGWTGRRGTLDHIVDGIAAGAGGEGVHRPDRLAQLLEGCRGGDQASRGERGAAWPVSLRQRRPCELARGGRARRRAILGIEPRLVPITVDQMPLRVPRPRYCALSTRKLAAAGFAMPTWRAALRRWLEGRG